VRVTDIPYPTDLERLRDNIREELQAQRAVRDLDLDDATLDGLADAIASNIEYVFSVEWAPNWADGGRRWTEPPGDLPTTWFVECRRCKRITVHPSSAEADAWWERHHQEHA
jgi:hypothetical protein